MIEDIRFYEGVFSIQESWGAIAALQQTFLLSPARVEVRREGSLPSLALPSIQEGQALAARILPLPSEMIEISSLGLKM